MIQGYERFKIPDENKKGELLIDVNWNPTDEQSNNCKLLRVTLPDGHVLTIKKEYLNAVLFAIGNPEEQRKMIPQKLHRVRWHETTLGVTATKDIHKGEQVVFPIKLTCTYADEEMIGEAMKREKLSTH